MYSCTYTLGDINIPGQLGRYSLNLGTVTHHSLRKTSFPEEDPPPFGWVPYSLGMSVALRWRLECKKATEYLAFLAIVFFSANGSMNGFSAPTNP